MSLTTILTAVIGGVIAGYLGMRTMDSLVGILFCLHALLRARWRHLTGKPPIRQVRPRILLQLLVQIALLAVIFVTLLYYAYDFIPRKAWIEYKGQGTILYAAVACATALVRLSAARQRLLFYWRMSHEVNYAQRRQRTLLLRG